MAGAAFPFDVDTLDANEFYFRGFHHTSNSSISDTDFAAIAKYLENPTNSGIWKLTGKWTPDSGISADVIAEYAINRKNGKEVTLSFGKRTLQVKLADRPEQDDLNIIKNKLSFLFSLFKHIHLITINDTSTREDLDEQYLILAESANLNVLKTKYNDAYNTFAASIYSQSFSSTVRSDRLCYIAHGSYLFVSNLERGHFEAIALSAAPLRAISTFLCQLGKLSDVHVAPIFSPEEDVLDPYFSYLKSVALRVLPIKRLGQLFAKAFDEFEQSRFQNCIGTIGLIAEDYTIQIYETLFREVCPKGLTLGQLIDVLHGRIQGLFTTEPPAEPDANPLYLRIKEIEGGKLAQEKVVNELIRLVRDAITFSRNVHYCAEHGLKEARKKHGSISVFAPRIRDNVDELIRFRNAASHKSRVPLGRFEALRTIYCMMSLIFWWGKELGSVNWELGWQEIVSAMVERNRAETEY